MPDIRSALAEHLIPGRFGAERAGAPIDIAERALGTLIQICGWRGEFAASVTPVMRRLGFDGPGGFRTAQRSATAMAFRIAPERILVRLQSRAAWDEIAGTIDQRITPTLDLSHARTVIRISGPSASDLLSRLLPLDFHRSVFKAGDFAQSGLHSVGVLIHRLASDDAHAAYELYVPYTFAASLWDYVTDHAAAFGYRVQQ